MSDTELIRRVLAWIDQDPDRATRHELALLLEELEKGSDAARSELTSRFSGHLTFGTAGLRAEIGAGPMRMNRVVVIHAAHGLGSYLRDAISDRPPRVVIGFDARTNSDVFAKDTAAVLSGMGIEAELFTRHTPTPVLAFALRHLGADAGVMVTASHNPPADNGYKVYLGGADEGSQIVPPTDRLIHDAIMASHVSHKASSIPQNTELVRPLGSEVIDAYITQTLRVADRFERTGRDALRICYTPMHGVGASVFEELLDRAGFSTVHVVPEQRKPDPSFPTVSFPNPEEPGALDLAMALAAEVTADLIVAHDPDADRLALAIPSLDRSRWQMLSGNDVGALLGSSIALEAEKRGIRGAIGYSLVSTPLARIIAEKHGHKAIETATGFKWISRIPQLLFGFEEALGYLVNPETVRDKDGISAGLYALSLAAEQHSKGRSLADLLSELRETYGGFSSSQVSLRFSSPEIAKELMALVRANPKSLFDPTVAVSRFTDYLKPSHGEPFADLVRYDLRDGGRIIIRPSGTEPKLKVYLDALNEDQAQAEAYLRSLELRVAETLRSLEQQVRKS